MKHFVKMTATAIGLSLMLTAGAAFADGWPASVAGRWSVVGNQSLGILDITQYPGAAGSQCKPSSSR